MSHFLRQLHLISSLRTTSEKGFYPFYKIIAVEHSRLTTIRNMQSICRNMKLKTAVRKDKEKKKLAIILSWILAKDTHIDKFRAIYLPRGFDVLTVHVVPKDLLFPKLGSQVIATNVLDYIQNNEQYDKIVMHAFSVGAYLMGEMFVKMHENSDKYANVSKRINGVVLDSAVGFETTENGISSAVSRNPLAIKVLEWYISTHLALMYNVSTKYHIKSSKYFHNTPFRCPALMYVSEADKIGTLNVNQLLAENWELRGVDVKMKIFKDSKHVSHLYKYRDEYVEELDNFLRKINLISNKL